MGKLRKQKKEQKELDRKVVLGIREMSCGTLICYSAFSHLERSEREIIEAIKRVRANWKNYHLFLSGPEQDQMLRRS